MGKNLAIAQLGSAFTKTHKAKEIQKDVNIHGEENQRQMGMIQEDIKYMDTRTRDNLMVQEDIKIPGNQNQRQLNDLGRHKNTGQENQRQLNDLGRPKKYMDKRTRDK